MTKQRALFWILTYQYLAGLSDTTTGWLLVLEPQWTLTLMGVRRIPQPIEFASFVGVFVLGVGVTYLYATRLPLVAANTARWQTIWALTALIRTLVALFFVRRDFVRTDGTRVGHGRYYRWHAGADSVDRLEERLVERLED